MNFLWPQFLWLLALLPVLLLLYVALLRRKKKLALRYASLSLVREAMGKGPGWRRHLPPALMLAALAAMLLAAARPVAVDPDAPDRILIDDIMQPVPGRIHAERGIGRGGIRVPDTPSCRFVGP